MASVSRSADKTGLYLEPQCVIWYMWFYCHHRGRCTWNIRFTWQKCLPCTLWNVPCTVNQTLCDYEGTALMERFIESRISALHGSCHSLPSLDFQAADVTNISFLWFRNALKRMFEYILHGVGKPSPFGDSCLSDPSSPHPLLSSSLFYLSAFNNMISSSLYLLILTLCLLWLCSLVVVLFLWIFTLLYLSVNFVLKSI